jgi:hypothetical protein
MEDEGRMGGLVSAWWIARLCLMADPEQSKAARGSARAAHEGRQRQPALVNRRGCAVGW